MPDKKSNHGGGVVTISEYNPSWIESFSAEEKSIRSTVKCAPIYIDHVGSTSVEGLPGKPIIDILISLSDWDAAGALVSELECLGYRVSEKCDDVPRYFLTKYSTNGSCGFHIHVCEPHRRWGREMLIFRDELAADEEFALSYGNLKKKLANEHHKDIKSYMVGKKDFIENKLREAQGEFGVSKLLTHQRAELNKAEDLQVLMMFTQFAVALIAAISVFSSSNKFLFFEAIAVFILMLLWLIFSQGQQRYRSAGDQARRVILLISGLNMDPSVGQRLRIIDGFKASILKMSPRREEDHFATREAPGYKRLSEMIEESSYWTRDLQQFSAKLLMVVLLILMVVAFVVGGMAITSMKSNGLISFSRATISIMVFFVSSDYLGLLLGYRGSALAIDEVFKRVETVSARGYLKSDTLLLMSDYNATIEKSPAPLPFVYKLRRNKLSQRWRAYVEARLSSHGSSSSENKSE
ncbi:GrpB family protein [Burkholderia contaminans]|uniref:GrpB family protein n=2 Tax=Burkholderia contaminans TaxID=488447 RepID=UPI001364C2D1|nr:GrpB family protein [Burkholderia contaminans]MEB4629291.1 GrpB family protein [Burkholderia contaminans]MEB4635473.1 GrpB family protein [Burkholderia contaminans]MEB4651305.1 GrpB family protein [Burkholderia contaminans]MEB4661804.1 GrpB family protein [Burkholderia contaminans]MEB4666584.1 GrpB family protein [Burkholderia contaminans]